MKRPIIVAFMLIAIFCVCFYSLHKVNEVKEEMFSGINAVFSALDVGDRDEVTRQANSLAEYWKREEKRLVHFVRHNPVDDITKSVARLPALAAFENDSDLAAELESIRWQISHIWDSELPKLENVF